MDQSDKSGAIKGGPCLGITWADEVDMEMGYLRDLIAAADYVLSHLKDQIELYGDGAIVLGLLALMDEHARKAKQASAILCGYRHQPVVV